ncbi:MAG: phosphotransferase, partial [Clostridium sp.]
FLGRIHAAGMDAIKSGFSYKRNKGLDMFSASLERARANVPSNILGRIESTMKKVRELPEDPRYFGMLHGDFHHNNFFLDGNNVWVFDFDDCHYGFFLYDIASICHSLLMGGYHFGNGKTSREVLNQDLLPYLKMGYELHMQFPMEHWKLLDLFLEFRFCVAAVDLCAMKDSGIFPDLEKAREFICFPLTQPDILSGCDMMLKKSRILVTNY